MVFLKKGKKTQTLDRKNTKNLTKSVKSIDSAKIIQFIAEPISSSQKIDYELIHPFETYEEPEQLEIMEKTFRSKRQTKNREQKLS